MRVSHRDKQQQQQQQLFKVEGSSVALPQRYSSPVLDNLKKKHNRRFSFSFRTKELEDIQMTWNIRRIDRAPFFFSWRLFASSST